jgi:hypothetical protein
MVRFDKRVLLPVASCRLAGYRARSRSAEVGDLRLKVGLEYLITYKPAARKPVTGKRQPVKFFSSPLFLILIETKRPANVPIACLPGYAHYH